MDGKRKKKKLLLLLLLFLAKILLCIFNHLAEGWTVRDEAESEQRRAESEREKYKPHKSLFFYSVVAAAVVVVDPSFWWLLLLLLSTATAADGTEEGGREEGRRERRVNVMNISNGLLIARPSIRPPLPFMKWIDVPSSSFRLESLLFYLRVCMCVCGCCHRRRRHRRRAEQTIITRKKSPLLLLLILILNTWFRAPPHTREIPSSVCRLSRPLAHSTVRVCVFVCGICRPLHH